jgi:hypothetical protein
MDQQLMLSKNEIARAVEAVRALTDVIEKLHKSTWPDVADSDILRKADLVEPKDDVADAALAALAEAEKRMERLEASRDLAEQYAPRKTMRYEDTRS